MSDSSYATLQSLHDSLPPFQPSLPPALHLPLGFVLLMISFALGFTFTTLPKHGLPLAEAATAGAASIAAGFGVVFLFNAAGVYL